MIIESCKKMLKLLFKCNLGKILKLKPIHTSIIV